MTAKLILFGRPRILYNHEVVDIRMKKAIALLAYLVTTGTAHDRERLATLLWPDASENVGRTSLRQALKVVRSTPLASMLITSRSSIELHPDVSSDVQAFLAYSATDYGQPLTPETATRLQAAAALYRGDFMQDFSIRGCAEWEDWQGLRCIELQYQATRIMAALTRYYTQQRLADSGLTMVLRWLELDPINEEAHHLAMQLYALDNQAQRALEQYHLLARMLERDQGRAPDVDIQRTYQRIRQGQYVGPSTAPPGGKPLRTLLPRPITPPPDHEAAGAALQRMLPTNLIAVVDPTLAQAPGLIATLAHRPDVQAMYPDGVLWAALEAPEDVEDIVRLWLDAMRVSILRSTTRLEHLAWQFHNGQRGRRLLFLLEWVEDAETARLLAPGYTGCTLIITTARREMVDELEDAHVLRLPL